MIFSPLDFIIQEIVKSKVNSELYFDLKTGKVKEKIQATSAQNTVFNIA